MAEMAAVKAVKEATMAKVYRLDFYVPEEHAERVKAAVFDAGAGRIGNYDRCAWQTAGRGQFRPLPGSKPAIGRQDAIERVAEAKVEMVCAAEHIEDAITALKAAHPYETPAFQYWPVEG
jgi:hypothetical protein